MPQNAQNSIWWRDPWRPLCLAPHERLEVLLCFNRPALTLPACPPECRDRPECELVPNGTRRHDSRYPQSGSLVNCNLRFGDEGKQRMLNYVDQAMMRWAARQGRWDVIRPLQQQRADELAASGGGAADGPAGATAAQAGTGRAQQPQRHAHVLRPGSEGAAAAAAEDS